MTRSGLSAASQLCILPVLRGQWVQHTEREDLKGSLTSLEVIKRLLRVPGLDVNVRDQLGLTPIYDAASWGYSDIVRLLVRAGADPNIPSNDGSTPTHVAASYGYAHTIEVVFLLDL